MRVLLPLIAALVLVACGGARSPKVSYAPEAAYRESMPAPGAPPAEYDADSVADEESLMELVKEERASKSDGGGDKLYPQSSLQTASPQKPPPQQQQQPPPQGPPVVVYTGYLKLRVKRLVETIDAITAHAEKVGGYIESMTAQVVVVRVPVATFESSMAAFEGMGSVLDREVRSVDVTARFTDLSARLAVAKEARQRLLALLEHTQDVQQRLRILQEIKRLSEQIETTESTLGTLRKLADFSTVTLALEPVLAQHSTQVHRSPFGWVRGLEPHHTTLPEGKSKIGYSVPRGFVLFEEDDSFRAQAADTSLLRAGQVENEPRGDARFWIEAIDHEMTGRDEEPVADGVSGGLAWKVYRSKDAQPRYALVGVLAAGDDLLVLEGFFPTEEAWKRHEEAVRASLGTFEAK